jgi:hypothetical protein
MAHGEYMDQLVLEGLPREEAVSYCVAFYRLQTDTSERCIRDKSNETHIVRQATLQWL